MDVGTILETYGLPGVVIFTLGWAVKHLWDRYNEVQDARIAEMRNAAEKNATLVREMKATLDATLAALKEVR